MKCPLCGKPTSGNRGGAVSGMPSQTGNVIDSRPIESKNAIRRRRLCECGYRFSTIETVVENDRDLLELERIAGSMLPGLRL